MDIFCIDVLKRQKEDKKMQRMAHFKKVGISLGNLIRYFKTTLKFSGSKLRRIQEFVEGFWGFPPVLFLGRGIFQVQIRKKLKFS